MTKREFKTVKDVLGQDSVKWVLDNACEQVEGIDTILIIYREKGVENEVHYATNCVRPEALGMCDMVHSAVLEEFG